MTRRQIAGALSTALTSDLMAWAAVPATRTLARRWPRARLARGAAYHLGTSLARRGQPVTSTLRSGVPIVLDPRDPAQREIAFFGLSEEGTTALITRLVTPGCTVLDVGANAGYYSLTVYGVLGETGHVHAFEPNPAMASALRESVILAGAGDAIVVNQLACGAARGVAELWVSRNQGEYGFATLERSVAWADDWRPVSVEVVDLDSYCEERAITPELVKMDVEGHEPSALRGMKRLLARGIPGYLICEVVQAPDRPAPELVIELLSDYGYRCFSIRDDGSLADAVDRPVIANLCFIAPGRRLP